MADTTKSPIYVLPDRCSDVVNLSIIRAFDTLLQTWPEVVGDLNKLTALASEQCAMLEDGRIQIDDGRRPLTNNQRMFRETFKEGYMIAYNLACQLLSSELYRTLKQYSEENRQAAIYGIATGILTPVSPDFRAGLARLGGLPL